MSNMWGPDDDDADFVEAVEMLENQNVTNDRGAQLVWDDFDSACDSVVEAAVERAEWDNAFSNAIVKVEEAGQTENITEYYESFGEIIAALDPNAYNVPEYIPEEPIQGLSFEDVIYGTASQGGVVYNNQENAGQVGAGYNIQDVPVQADYGSGAEQFGAGRRRVQPVDEPLFTVVRKSQRYYEKFHTQGVRYTLNINTPNDDVHPEVWLKNLLSGIISHFFNDSTLAIRDKDRIGMILENDICNTTPVYISLRYADQLSAEIILDHIMKIFDSNKEFFLNGALVVQFDHVQLPHGSGRLTRDIGESGADFIAKKACFLKYKIPARYSDNYCLPYALVLGRAFVRSELGEITKEYFRKYQETFKLLRCEAVNLCLEAGVDMTAITAGCSIEEVRKFQEVLSDYQIVIFLGLDLNNEPYTDSRYRQDDRKINIMHHDNHYYTMRNITACFAAKFICPDCRTQADSRLKHSCKYACSFCETKPVCPSVSIEEMITCEDCHRDFLGEDCFDKHLVAKGKYSLCEVRKKCPICDIGYTKDNDHVCGVFYCRICEDYESYAHQCHMPKYATKHKDDKKYLFVFYDFETQQDVPMSDVEPNKFRHVPNLCVVQTACTECFYEENISKRCYDCGPRQRIYYNKNCVADLINFLVEKAKEREIIEINGQPKNVFKYSKVTAIAHNMSGFDGQFILGEIYRSDRFPNVNMILNGTRAILISLRNRINFIDSLNYFHVGLAKLPALFGFPGSKGYYCHLFNTDSNKNYIGPIPEKHFYAPESMSVDGRKEFEKWYDSLPSDYLFNNRKELLMYCIQDVNILRKACLKFAEDFWECNKIDPFLDACTIAGACNKVFRSKFLEKDTISVLPRKGYRYADNQSKIAIKWLCHVEEELGIEIMHAGRGREVNIQGVGRVDGLFEKTVFEFNGCYYHAHSCIKNQLNTEDNSPKARDMAMRKEETITKHRKIKEAGYNLIVMYECDFMKKLKDNPELAKKLKNHPMVCVEPLNPRDAFYGGRTNANTLYFKADSNTKMYYYDICSLYPWANKYTKTVLGHPTIYVGHDCKKVSWQSIDGLMKVTVLPPRRLDFPVLPTRMHSKLMFVLCNTCGLELNQAHCDHSDEERAISGTWVIDEVKLAVKKGYEVVEIDEIWEYKTTQYSRETRKGGLFSDYIDAFLKIKSEASGYPDDCTSDAQKQAYIDEFYEREGIRLDPKKIKYNPSLRQLAKIQLNSFWGRFGKREDLPKTVLVSSYHDLVNKMFDNDIEITHIIPINEKNMLLNYKDKEEARIPDKTTNVVIAAFTTAYARMELYKYLDFLGSDRVYYYDTDSVFFIARPGDEMPVKGEFLGMMTDELSKFGLGSYIVEFVSGGPKNYAFKVYSTNKNEIITKIKIKGITFNFNTAQTINFDVMKHMITGPTEGTAEIIQVADNCIRRTNLGEVYTTRVPKTYRFDYTKRQKTDIEYRTVPYGY